MKRLLSMFCTILFMVILCSCEMRDNQMRVFKYNKNKSSDPDIQTNSDTNSDTGIDIEYTTTDAPIQCGGSYDRSDYDASKSITSTEITKFYCEFVPDDYSEDYDFAHGRYQFSADIKGGMVEGYYRLIEFDSDFVQLTYDFKTDLSFMQKLQKLVSDNNLARHNGYHHETYGIPEEFGASIHIDYASGEYISADNNSSNFINPAAATELYHLFYEVSGAKDFEENEELHSIYYRIYGEKGKFIFIANIDMTPDRKIYLTMTDYENNDENTSGLDTANRGKKTEKEVSTELFDRIDEVNRDYGLSDTSMYPHRESNGISISLGLKYGKTEKIVRSNDNLTEEQYEALLAIREIIMEYGKS